MAGRNNWTDEETILAFYYYCQIPFGKIHKTNPLIIKIAEMIGRSPSAVVFKMGNLGHFDPSLQARNVKGLSNASKRDEQVVNKFIHDWESLAIQAKQIEAAFLQKSIEQVVGIDIMEGRFTLCLNTIREQLLAPLAEKRMNSSFGTVSIILAILLNIVSLVLLSISLKVCLTQDTGCQYASMICLRLLKITA